MENERENPAANRTITDAMRAKAVKAIADGRLSIAPIFGQNGILGWEVAGDKNGQPHSFRITASTQEQLPDTLIAALMEFDAMHPH
ncbi:MAG: hypothetical protein ACTHN5_01080 [Phycisphaerae bacterium]